MELRQIRYFVAVAEHLNISKAARQLHTSQPSLGRQIQALEDFMGLPLFNRVNRRLSLTRAGEIFFHRAKSFLADIDDAVLKTRVSSLGNKRGITIGYVPPAASKIFPFFLSFLGGRHPDIYPILKNISSDEQIIALKSNYIDIAFLRKCSDDESIEVLEVIEEDIVVLLPASHALARKESVSLAELAALPFVEVAKPLRKQLEDNLGPLAFRPVEASGTGQRDNLFDQLSLVGSGLGFTLLTDFVKDFVPPTVAIRQLATDHPPRIKLHVAYRKGDRSDILKDFLDSLWMWKEQRDGMDKIRRTNR